MRTLWLIGKIILFFLLWGFAFGLAGMIRGALTGNSYQYLTIVIMSFMAILFVGIVKIFQSHFKKPKS